MLCIVCGYGYKEEEIYKEFFSKMKELDIDIIDLHVSGHADYTAFKQLFDITKPDIVIPTHTEDKYKITQYTDKAVILNDMETLDINEKGEYRIIMNEYLKIEQGKLKLPQAELITIGVKPNVHKSTVAIHIADNISKQNKPVAIFSLETSKQALLENLENTDNIYIDDTTNVTLDYIKDQCKSLVHEQNVKLVIIDYLQLIQDHVNINIMEQLKQFAEENNITIILLSQQLEELNSNTKPIIENIKNKTLRELIDSLVFLYENDINQIEMNIANNTVDKAYEPITYQEVIERLKDKKLEDYTREDTLDRYIAYGTEEELKEPKIQQLLIKHKLYNELIDFADIIEDKQVIQDLLSSELFNDKSIYLIEGKILNIEKRILTEETNGNNIYYSMVTLEDKHTLKPIELKAQVLLDLEALEDYKKELKPYYNTNIVALVGNTNQELCIRCYLKYYDDIDYDRYCKS